MVFWRFWKGRKPVSYKTYILWAFQITIYLFQENQEAHWPHRSPEKLAKIYFMKPADYTYHTYYSNFLAIEASGLYFIQVRVRPLSLSMVSYTSDPKRAKAPSCSLIKFFKTAVHSLKSETRGGISKSNDAAIMKVSQIKRGKPSSEAILLMKQSFAFTVSY